MAISKITTKGIADNAVTSIKLAPGSVTVNDIPDSEITMAKLSQVNLDIAPEVLEIQVAAPAAGQDTAWLWTWEQSTLPYARRTITNSPEIQVPLYKQGTYVVNNYAAYDIFDQMTQTHSLYLKWIDGAGTDNLVSWAVDDSNNPISDTHPDINGGVATDVQRINISVPSTITLPTLTAPSVSYNVTNNGSGAYTFSGSASGDNPNIGPFYRGGTYTINITATGHPFYFTTDNGTNFSAGTYFGEYTTGVTGSRTDSGTITFTVPQSAPDTLYYQCGNHSAMRGAITVKDLAVETNNNGNYVVYFQHTQEGHKTPVELRPIPSLVNQMCLVYDASSGKFVPQDLATYVENTPSFENKIREVAGTAELVVEDGSAVVAKVNVYADSTYLPLTGNNAGDQAFATDVNTLFVWDGSSWQPTKGGTLTDINATGDVTIGGNLTVNGTTTTINSTTLAVDDLNITLASGAADSTAANGAGITVDGANATITYDGTNDEWDFNKDVNVTGNLYSSGYVGIGTTTPYSASTDFEVKATDPKIVLNNTGTRAFGLVVNGTKLYIRDESDNETHMTVTEQGNIGIGTQDPGYKLQVNGNIDILNLKGSLGNAFLRFTDGDSSADWSIGSDDGSGGGAGSFILYDRNATAYRLAVKSDGNIGMGTVAPVDKLHIYGNEGNGTMGIVLQDDGWGAPNGQYKLTVRNSDGAFAIRKNLSSNFDFATSDDHLVLTSSGGKGKLGINRDTNLDSTVTIEQASDGPNGGIRIYGSDSNSIRGQMYYDGTQSFVIHGTSGPSGEFSTLRFATGVYTNPQIRMSINKDNGYVGIGTTNPGSHLHVYTSNNETAYMRIGSASQESGINFDEGTTGKFQFRYRPSQDRFDFYSNTFSGNVMSIKDNTGNVGIAQENPQTKLHVNGPVIIQNTGIKYFTTTFTHNVSNLATSINLGTDQFWGTIKITVTGDYSNENVSGVYTKVYGLGLNPGGVEYSNESQILENLGATSTSFQLANYASWNNVTNTWYIPLYKLTNTGNGVDVKIEVFGTETTYTNEVIASSYLATPATDGSVSYKRPEYSSFTMAPGSTQNDMSYVHDGLKLHFDANVDACWTSGTNPYCLIDNTQASLTSVSNTKASADGVPCIELNDTGNIQWSGKVQGVPRTYEIWVYHKDANVANRNWETYFDDNSTESVLFGKQGSTDNLSVYTSGVGASDAIRGQKWQQFVYTIDDVNNVYNVRVFKNGEIVSRAFSTLNRSLASAGSTLYMGGDLGQGESMYGYIALARCYNRALTNQEVRQNFDANRQRFKI